MSDMQRFILYALVFWTVVNIFLVALLLRAVQTLLRWATSVITNGWKYED